MYVVTYRTLEGYEYRGFPRSWEDCCHAIRECHKRQDGMRAISVARWTAEDDMNARAAQERARGGEGLL